MPTICLTMIVKDEGHLIRETLRHLLTYIRFDSWCICDTGSTDNTIEEIESFFAQEGIPGSIYRHEWKDFGHNRTLAFEMAYNTSDYTFVWDADDEIVGQFSLPHLDKDWYRFTFGARGSTQYRRCQLFNNRKKWKYVGVLHECPSCTEDCGQPQDILGDYHFISGRRGARNKDPKKYVKDAMILDKAFEEAFAAKDGLYKRYAFYCAQSYLCAGEREKAIEFYKKVLSFDTWSQEQYIACMEIYDSYEHLGRPKEGLFYLVESFRYDSKRAECVMRLIKYYLNAGLPQVALMYYRGIQDYYEKEYGTDAIQEKLFVKRCDADFYLPYYMIIVAERTGNLDLCAKMFTAIVTYKYLGVTAWWVQNAFHNLQFFIERIPKTVDYVQLILDYLDLVRSKGITLQDAQNAIVQRYLRSCDSVLTSSPKTIVAKASRVRVMLTITTCKRLELFQKTVRSMLTTWTDIEEVDYFFCVDDASSKEDRDAMVAEFPFFTYYMKTLEEKGHRESMNIIWKKLTEVKPDYWIHLEDDWLFFRKKAYVGDAIKLLEKYESHKIHQVVFNRNYGVVYQDLDRVGGIDLGDAILHEKRDGLVGKNCGYWPHYSLQPSMVRTRVILELGDYTSPNVFFERDYANKYFSAGYMTLFFPTMYSNHIGKQHWEKEGKNAYALNTVNQFATQRCLFSS
jgi:glycosyltransferase involved in cell wall biosynthesis